MATTITTYAGKGGRLSHAEVDANFTNLKATADAAAPQSTTYTKTEVDSAISGVTGGAVASAAKLTTARNIAGVSFDGTANISIPFANLSSIPTTAAGYGITDVYTKTSIDAMTIDGGSF